MDIPIVKAILICDNIITEAVTNKRSLIGIFEKIKTKTFPCVHSILGVYVKFTNALGKYAFKLELRDVASDKILGAGDVPGLECKDKLASNELAFILAGLKFDRPGKYEFRLLANGKVCENGTKSFEIIEKSTN